MAAPVMGGVWCGSSLGAHARRNGSSSRRNSSTYAYVEIFGGLEGGARGGWRVKTLRLGTLCGP